jgi:hypothetical protein
VRLFSCSFIYFLCDYIPRQTLRRNIFPFWPADDALFIDPHHTKTPLLPQPPVTIAAGNER